MCISGVDCRNSAALSKEKAQVISPEQPDLTRCALWPGLLELLKPDGRMSDLPLNCATIPCLNDTSLVPTPSRKGQRWLECLVNSHLESVFTFKQRTQWVCRVSQPTEILGSKILC